MISDIEVIMYDQAFAYAETLLQKNGQLQPFSLIVTGLSMHILPADDFSTEAHKDDFAMAMKMMTVKLKADLIIYVSESWAVASSKLTANDIKQLQDIQRGGRSIREHPKCKEVIFVVMETHSGTKMGMREITRPRPDWIELKDFDRPTFASKNDDVQMQGRFANLLAPRDIQNDTKMQQYAEMFVKLRGIDIEPIEITPGGVFDPKIN